MRRDDKILTLISSLKQVQEHPRNDVRKGPDGIGCNKFRQELHFIYLFSGILLATCYVSDLLLKAGDIMMIKST